MHNFNVEKPLIVLVGPTAVGKTAASIKIAQALNAEIISADSRYFYRKMDIGTAKPDFQEMNGVKHHLVNVADPDETWSLAAFKDEALQIIENLHQQNRIPLIVGGTGQYITAVMQAWQMPELPPVPMVREGLERISESQGKKYLHDILAGIDPDAAGFIDYRNVRRTIRALEVIFMTGKKFSDQRKIASSPFSRKIIGLKRERTDLYQRIDQRIEKMIEDGLIDEVKNLLDLNYDRKLPSMSAIGYREIAAYLEGEIDLEEAIRLIKRQTRIYVRRQANWFKETDPEIKWFDAETVTTEEIVKYINQDQGWLLPNLP